MAGPRITLHAAQRAAERFGRHVTPDLLQTWLDRAVPASKKKLLKQGHVFGDKGGQLLVDRRSRCLFVCSENEYGLAVVTVWNLDTYVDPPKGRKHRLHWDQKRKEWVA